MSYSVLKALHIIFMVSWFAGLFYIVRLFIYHTEAREKSVNEKNILSNQFIIMERKLWWIITTPAMVLTIFLGIALLTINSFLLEQGWMHLKLGFVALLLVYHFICQKTLFQLARGKSKWSSNQLRLWNELATLLLVIIVFLVVMKNSLNWIYATVGFFAVAVALMMAVKIYKRLRNKKQ